MELNAHVVFIVLYKPEHEQLAQIVGVHSDHTDAARNALTFVDEKKVWWDEHTGTPLTESVKSRLMRWNPTPGDDAEWELSSDGEHIFLQMHEVEYPVSET